MGVIRFSRNSRDACLTNTVRQRTNPSFSCSVQAFWFQQKAQIFARKGEANINPLWDAHKPSSKDGDRLLKVPAKHRDGKLIRVEPQAGERSKATKDSSHASKYPGGLHSRCGLICTPSRARIMSTIHAFSTASDGIDCYTGSEAR